MPESTRHRQAFDRYFRLGPNRSIERLHDELMRQGTGRSLRTLYEWSSRYDWQGRLAEEERRARQVDSEARVAAQAEMQSRQAKEALFLQQKGTEWLSQIGPEQVSAEAAIRAIAEGIRLERLVQGEPTQRTEVIDHTGLEGLTDDDLAELAEVVGRNLGRDAQARPR